MAPHGLLFLALAATAAALRTKAPSTAHPWPTMRGPLLHQYGTSDVVVPRDLTSALLWSWHHPLGRYNSLIAGGPLIDTEKNLYVSSSDGVRKLSPEGQQLWFYPIATRKFNNQASLYGDKVYSSNEEGVAFAIDQKTGKAAWTQKLARNAGGDAGYPAAHDGVFVVAGESGQGGGNQKVFGLEANTGSWLWEFAPAKPVWNFEPLFPGNGNVVFMDFSGGMYSVGLHNGSMVWHTPAAAAEASFSDGGATLGPNGLVYSCSNPGANHGDEGTQGLLRAYRVADGRLSWEQLLPQPCNSYPAVGKLGRGEELSVVVTPGSFMGKPGLHGSIMAFDSEDGAPQWRYNGPAYTGSYHQAKGDVEGYETRSKSNGGHPICLPAHWSAANIDASGTVFAGRSDGFVYGVHGPAAPVNETVALVPDFQSTPGLDVRRWDADGASLHGAFAFAPGMVAFATCDTLYVFKA